MKSHQFPLEPPVQQTKEERMAFRVSKEIKQLLKERAKKDNRKTSDWIRLVVEAALIQKNTKK